MNIWQIYIRIHHPYEMYMRFCGGNHELLRRGFIRGFAPYAESGVRKNHTHSEGLIRGFAPYVHIRRG
jgi:hypothetical protein